MVGNPIRIEGERTDAPLPPPALGEHDELLREMLGDEEYDRLKAAGVVG
jgi:crotonobetainyl-CoA:carnitine CoA-transferase CaiB-like acyl-CoA transferase